MNRFKANIIRYTPEAWEWAKEFGAEDSKKYVKEFKARVIYIDTAGTDILQFDIIKLARPFYFDTGKALEIVTAQNYKDYDINKVLTSIPEKYIQDDEGI